MKAIRLFFRNVAVVAPVLLAVACVSDPNRVTITNPHQPGPALGQALGATVGVVGGNAAGAVVGFTEGAVGGAAVSFDNTKRVIRRWRSESTPDGRIVQIPEDIEVDAYGRPLRK